jgi:quercetin dioxygenase-like cupin family protein
MKFRIVRSEGENPRSLSQKLRQEGWSLLDWKDPPGTQYPPHRHPHDEVILMIEGTIQFRIDENIHTLNPGDRLFLPSGTVHSATVPIGQEAHFAIGSPPPAQNPS